MPKKKRGKTLPPSLFFVGKDEGPKTPAVNHHWRLAFGPIRKSPTSSWLFSW
jgi:hypothetical protein